MSEMHEVLMRSELNKLAQDYAAMQEMIATASDPDLKKNLEAEAEELVKKINEIDPTYIDRLMEYEARKLSNGKINKNQTVH